MGSVPIARRSGRLRPGASLVEMLIVVAVVNLLAAVAVPRYGSVVVKARGVAVAADIRTIADAARRYEMDHGAWPADTEEGIMPAELEPYLPPGLGMRGQGYSLDWESWALEDGSLFGITVATADERLGAAVEKAMGQQRPVHLEDKRAFLVGRGRGRSSSD